MAIAHPIQEYRTAGNAIEANRIVKFTASETVDTADSATAALAGITGHLRTETTDTTVDVIKGGRAYLKIGGTVSAGDFLTANATGLGVASTTAGNIIIARAEQDGVANDIIAVFVSPFLI